MSLSTVETKRPPLWTESTSAYKLLFQRKYKRDAARASLIAVSIYMATELMSMRENAENTSDTVKRTGKDRDRYRDSIRKLDEEIWIETQDAITVMNQLETGPRWM